METLLTTRVEPNSTLEGYEILINCANIVGIAPNTTGTSKVSLINGKDIIIDEPFEALVEILHEKG